MPAYWHKIEKTKLEGIATQHVGDDTTEAGLVRAVVCLEKVEANLGMPLSTLSFTLPRSLHFIQYHDYSRL